VTGSAVVLELTFPLRYISNDTPGSGQRFTLSTVLTLEKGYGPDVSYTLTDVVYLAGARFSARWKDTCRRWRAYSGVNSGRPSLDLVTDGTQLTKLGDRVVRILLCRLDPTDFKLRDHKFDFGRFGALPTYRDRP